MISQFYFAKITFDVNISDIGTCKPRYHSLLAFIFRHSVLISGLVASQQSEQVEGLRVVDFDGSTLISLGPGSCYTHHEDGTGFSRSGRAPRVLQEVLFRGL